MRPPLRLKRALLLIIGRYEGRHWPPSRVATSPWRALIFALLSTRTRDEVAALAAQRLLSRYPSPRALSRARVSEIAALIKEVGFWRVKARHLKAIGRALVEGWGGRVPKQRVDLLSLPGVGPKVAACIELYGFGRAVVPVDVHVHRVLNRIGLVSSSSPARTQAVLEHLVKVGEISPTMAKKLNSSLIQFGREFCAARPLCANCPVRKQCAFFKRR